MNPSSSEIATARFAVSYIDSILADGNYNSLVEISTIVCSSSRFSAYAPDYQLPQPIFLFGETLLWFAQAIRSGVSTYYEATPIARQEAMHDALLALAPAHYATSYRIGMEAWKDPARMSQLDAWIEEHDKLTNSWLRTLANSHRTLILELS